MIEFIECFKPNQNFYKFSKENYYEFIEGIFPGYYYNYQSVVTWKNDNKKHCFSNKLLKHIPLKNWDGIAFILENQKELVICNSDGSIRLKVNVPSELIQIEDFQSGFNLSESETQNVFNDDEFIMSYDRFDDYFEFEGKSYISVKVKRYHSSNSQDAFLQMRYLDCKTGEFLPFTKTISKYVENQHGYNEASVNI
ncbi:hypothetical protein [uncultured Psychroserpens sp.]|uniref:hypothetical protein n=1 Tax=uncultured Psychroserpens sp. TaxID=255436 RepID=UPI0026092C3F|nr:hypothetical protein [uncultured Psychroserpens sp.]